MGGLNSNIFMHSFYQHFYSCCYELKFWQEEYVEGDDLGTLDCGHDFHTSCIKQWLMQKNLCPICKTTALTSWWGKGRVIGAQKLPSLHINDRTDVFGFGLIIYSTFSSLRHVILFWSWNCQGEWMKKNVKNVRQELDACTALLQYFKILLGIWIMLIITLE